MTRTGKFISPEELEGIKTEMKCSGMWLSGGQPLGDPEAAVEHLRKQYNMPEGTGVDVSNGEFVTP